MGKLSSYDSATPVSTDYVPFIQTSTGLNKKGLVSAISTAGTGDMNKTVYDPANIGQQLVGTTATQTLTNKTLTSPAITTPTGIVKGDVGLGNVDNTADTAKPVSTAQQTALNLKANLASPTFTGTVTIPTGGSITAPTGLVKGDVGLSNVDNTSDATKNAAAVTLTNKTLTSPVINTPTGIVKGDVGLGNVDNTSDATKNSAVATLTNKTLTSPKIGTSILDTNGNELAKLTATGSAVNEVTVANAATGLAPTISATGDDTDITLWFKGKGAGGVVLADASSQKALETTTVGTAVNNLVIYGRATGVPPSVNAAGSDSNISINIVPKGTGVVQSNGVEVPTISSTNTLTNKRVTKRTGTTTSSATPTINTDNVDFYSLTAQTVDITSFSTNLSGTPTTGQTLWIAITGTAARAITWGASFEASTVALPTTTVTTNRLDVGFIWTGSIWRCVASC